MSDDESTDDDFDEAAERAQDLADMTERAGGKLQEESDDDMDFGEGLRLNLTVL